MTQKVFGSMKIPGPILNHPYMVQKRMTDQASALLWKKPMSMTLTVPKFWRWLDCSAPMCFLLVVSELS